MNQSVLESTAVFVMLIWEGLILSLRLELGQFDFGTLDTAFGLGNGFTTSRLKHCDTRRGHLTEHELYIRSKISREFQCLIQLDLLS